MQPIPDDIVDRFNAVLGQRAVSTELQDEYRKWLRYYLDFRVKYPLPNEKSEHVRLFIEKMRSKGKSRKSLHHAAHALSRFFSLRMKVKPPESRTCALSTVGEISCPVEYDMRYQSFLGCFSLHSAGLSCRPSGPQMPFCALRARFSALLNLSEYFSLGSMGNITA